MNDKKFQVVIALSFGQGRGDTPGLINEKLAKIVVDLDKNYDLPIIAQWEIADCIPELMKGENDLTVRESRQEGQYLDTVEVLAEAKAHCNKLGIAKVIIIAHPDHVTRALAVAQSLGFEAIAADTKDIGYDPDSAQEWTKSREKFLGWNEFAKKIFPILGNRLRNTEANGPVKTSLMGAPVSGDLNHDGVDDYGFVFFQQSGADKFYYLIAGMVDFRTFSIAETTVIFLGKNTAFRKLAIKNNKIFVESLCNTREFIVEKEIIKESYDIG